MKQLFAVALVLLAGSASAATEGVNFKHQKHYTCTWLFTGTATQAPDLFTAVNPNSGAMTLQRMGAQVYYAKKVTEGIWEEINPTPGQDAEDIRVRNDGVLDTYQGNTKISECIEVE